MIVFGCEPYRKPLSVLSEVLVKLNIEDISSRNKYKAYRIWEGINLPHEIRCPENCIAA